MVLILDSVLLHYIYICFQAFSLIICIKLNHYKGDRVKVILLWWCGGRSTQSQKVYFGNQGRAKVSFLLHEFEWPVNVAHTLVLAEFTDICVRREYLQTGKNKLTASSLYRSWFFLNASKDKEQRSWPFGISRSFCLWVRWGW